MTRARRWLRANVWTLAILVALVAASVWASLSTDWARIESSNPTQVLDVPSGKQATYDGGVFSLSGMTVLASGTRDGDRYDVADGTDVVVVDLKVTPRENGDPDDFVSCDVRLLAPSPDGQREWWPEGFNPTTYPDGDPDVFSCNIAGGPAYLFRQFFIVPAGGASAATVQVTIPEALPLALHLH